MLAVAEVTFWVEGAARSAVIVEYLLMMAAMLIIPFRWDSFMSF